MHLQAAAAAVPGAEHSTQHTELRPPFCEELEAQLNNKWASKAHAFHPMHSLPQPSQPPCFTLGNLHVCTAPPPEATASQCLLLGSLHLCPVLPGIASTTLPSKSLPACIMPPAFGSHRLRNDSSPRALPIDIKRTYLLWRRASPLTFSAAAGTVVRAERKAGARRGRQRSKHGPDSAPRLAACSRNGWPCPGPTAVVGL